MKQCHIIVTGANGWLGSRISVLLGGRSLGLVSHRSASLDNERTITCDLSSSESSRTLIDRYYNLGVKAEVMIHCAGLAHRPIETNSVKVEMRRVNIQGTANVIDFCKEVGIGRLIYISTIAGYDWNQLLPVGESSLINSITEYAKTKLIAEKLVLESDLDGRAVRLATVFGSGDKANFLKLSTALKKRRFIIPGNGSARKSVIPVDLAARLIAEFAILDEPKHRLINLALPEAPTLKEICDSFSSACDFPRAPSVPLPLLKGLAKVGDLASHIRPMPLNSSVIAKLTTSTWVDTQRMLEVFGTIPRDSFATHLQRHSDYYRDA